MAKLTNQIPGLHGLQVRLNEEVPEFFRTSDAMKQTVEIVEDEEDTSDYHMQPQGY